MLASAMGGGGFTLPFPVFAASPGHPEPHHPGIMVDSTHPILTQVPAAVSLRPDRFSRLCAKLKLKLHRFVFFIEEIRGAPSSWWQSDYKQPCACASRKDKRLR